MRVAWLTLTVVLMPVAAMAGTDIVATCYQTKARIPIPNIKPAARVPRGQGGSAPERQL